MALNALNNLAVGFECTKISDLIIGEKYIIKDAKLISTKYGPRVLLTLEDRNVFLPQRFQSVSSEQISSMIGSCIINITKPTDKFAKFQFIR